MDDRYDFRAIEARWQERWEADGTFRARADSERPKYYALEMFPYPSGAGLSVGHVKNYAPADAFCRFKSMNGFNVLHPMGWDAFGQPAENEAIKRGRNPRDMVPEYAANYRRTLKRVGCTYDWDREVNSSDPEYYRWTQWIFLLLYKRGLTYRATAQINWCPSCKTGLANEEVKEGRCWRCGTSVEKRPLPQWYFRITEYAERLLNDLELINWPEGVKQMQREWIGRSEGAEVAFPLPAGVAAGQEAIRVFTTRPDTLWGATFMVLAPEHPLVGSLTTPDRRADVEAYVARAQLQTEIERASTERTKTGVFTGGFALNPVTGGKVPVWVADYVLMGYGTGAIMAVPAHDQRDFEFARKYHLPIELVYSEPGGPQTADELSAALPHNGTMRAFTPAQGSGVPVAPFSGMPNDKATVLAVIEWLEARGLGKGRVNYKLRDWLISRQRYWGAPIPMVHCSRCGEVPVPEDQLPVRLPDVENYQPSDTGESPLATIPEFVNTTCPVCGEPARRETDTMGGFACSSWYFLRFADPHNDRAFASRASIDYWLPVDMYIGGREHAVMHLLYARFWTKALFDAGEIGFTEPFLTLKNQGSMLAYTPGRRPASGDEAGEEEDDERVIDWIVLKPEEREGFPEDKIVWRWARMSKSKGNVVTPDEMCERYGADSLRLYEMFVAPLEDDVQWNEDGINGSYRFLNRVWRWANAAQAGYRSDWSELEAEGARGPESVSIRRKLHQTIRKVTDNLEGFRFNTAIAAIMELVNDLYVYQPLERSSAAVQLVPDPALTSEALETLILLLAPFAPHFSDELWTRIGKAGSTYKAQWPEADATAAAVDEITLIVQVNGKLRDRITVRHDATEEELRSSALASPKVAESVNGFQVRKVIVVPGKLVNVVIG